LGNTHARLHGVFLIWEMLMYACMGFSRFGKYSCTPAWGFSSLGNARVRLHGVFPVWEMLMHACMGFFRFGKYSCTPAWGFPSLGNAHARLHEVFPVWKMLMCVCMGFFLFVLFPYKFRKTLLVSFGKITGAFQKIYSVIFMRTSLLYGVVL
jgi:hypothetical protein